MEIEHIENKVIKGGRISEDEALLLFKSDDIFSIGRMASKRAYEINRDKVFYIHNRHINPTNICVNRCAFCAFSRSPGQKGAYEMAIDEILKRAESAVEEGAIELHIVGGLHPERPFNFYIDMLKKIKDNFPDIYIKAFTAVEIDYFSKISGLSIEEVLRSLIDAGLDCMPGGGAEIFDVRVRNRICPEKISGRRWLEIMEIAHNLGIRTNATMLYGHVEGYEERVDHLNRLRELQDRTGGFQAFIPLPFLPKNTEIPDASYTSGIDDIKTIAISRIFLDNIPHIKAYWIMLGPKIAQLSLCFGADDLEGTVIEEKIANSAGGMTKGSMTEHELIHIIKKAKKIPVKRDSLYREIG
ncbi:MAG: aminofutalosine synthase MqnE [Nitrospirae bacterium]|nr:MAG: aminofutalosine synthase MqnE [Nitrospirota bacterium]